ncbi:MAG: FIST N-terminal domain-containing protein [Capsulimonadaceae bacterium]|nr:FIST N-terminal domain-containing protein [Capsulimonadaceae bacterium]
MISIAHSTRSAVDDAVDEIESAFAGIDPALVLYFASSHYAPEVISKAVQSRFPASRTVGCSTAGEIVSGMMLKNSIAAMAFDKASIGDFEIAVVQSLKSAEGVAKAFRRFEDHFGKPMLDLDPASYIGLVLVDGLSSAEDRLMEAVGNQTKVLFVGGSAGDDLKFQETYVYADGVCYPHAAVLTLAKPGVRFDVLKTQSFAVLPLELTATKVDERARTVVEFNGKPAAIAYAEAAGCRVDNLPRQFMRHPLALLIDEEPFVRSPQRVEGTSLVFYCRIKKGTTLSLLESRNIVEDTAKAIAAKRAEFGCFKGLINFNCILRTQDLEDQDLSVAYGSIFAEIPTVGFSTYGEQYLSHVNQTATMLVFG